MPQDSLRSVYKSFVPCGDDLKCVAECNIVNKRTLTKSHKIKNQKSSSTTLSMSLEEERKVKAGKGLTVDLQVREVSRGAEKLNEVLDSFACRTRFNQKPEYIAKDLLKGALDLQESLAMLRKFQEISQHVAKPKKSDNGKRVGNNVMNFSHIERYDHFQNPRSSVASSRDCYEELRDVIVESFSRNNLLPKNSVHEKAFSTKSVDFFTDVPSSSSSHSLSSDCSSSRVHPEKPKGPNLIAKLMGLEEVSSKHANPVLCKEMKTSGPTRHLLDFDLPKPKKPQFVLQKPARERISLEEMMESMQFKVLVDKKSVGEPKHHSECLSPPIVIMKPFNVRANYGCSEEKPSKGRSLMPVKMRDEYPSDSVRVAGGRSSFTQLNEKSPARKTHKKLKDELGDNNGESPARLPKKITNNIQNNISPVKSRHYRPLSLSMQKEETVVKKIDGVTKMASDTRKQAEIKPSAKSRDSINSQDLSRSAVSKLAKPGQGSNVSKSQIARGKHASTDNKMTPKTSPKTVSPKKNLTEDKLESNPSETTVESIPRDDVFPINLATSEPGTIMTSTTLEQVPEEVADASCNPISDNCERAESYHCDFSPSIVEDVKHLEDSSYTPYRYVDEKKSCTKISNTGYFLLCSASFLSHTNRLLDIEIGDPRASPIDCIPGNELEDANLLLECAKEIMERKRARCTMFPLDHHSRKANCHLSLEELVTGVSNVIEDLRSYSKCYGDNIVADSISSVLKRDIRWNSEMNGVWETGWRNGFSSEEVNEVANDLQNSLLNELVDDVVTKFMF